jgi:Na+/melibiose symporter-like transporter
MGTDEKLSTCVKISYSLPRGTTQAMGLLLQTTVRSLVYIEAFGMQPKVMAMLIAAAKSLDLIIGFMVGHASDHCKTKWGRRKPFIMIGFPIWTVVMLCLFNPPSSFSAGHGTVRAKIGDGVCEGLNNSIVNSSSISAAFPITTSECPITLSCARSAQSAGVLPLFTDTWETAAVGAAGSGLTVWFAVFYFLFYSIGYSFTIIPYDALGMELTSD